MNVRVHYYVFLTAKARNESSACGSVIAYESTTVNTVMSLILDVSHDIGYNFHFTSQTIYFSSLTH